MRRDMGRAMKRALTALTRREFFGAGLGAVVLGALGVRSEAAASLKQRMFDDSIYTRLLGVRPHLAGHGYTTVVGGSRLPAEVQRAMTEAADHFVDMFELNEAAGRRLAEVTQAEAAMVTAGSFSALLLGAAACLSGTDPDKVKALPQPTWPKRECLTQKAHRVAYDKAYQVAGMTIVEVDTREELARAVNANTAMIHALASVERRHDRPPEVMLPQELIAIGKRAGVPVLVDLAAELPPASNLTRYTGLGADLIVISGGKGLRGPQSTGILAGRGDLIEAARLHGFPNTALGRGMKVGKEEVVGLIAAVNRFLALDHDALAEQWIRTAKFVAAELQAIPGLQAEYVPARMTVLGYDAVELQWDPKIIPLSPEQVRQRLRDGEPRIIFSGTTFITRNLENGEEILVARRLRQFFKDEAPRGASSAAGA